MKKLLCLFLFATGCAVDSPDPARDYSLVDDVVMLDEVASIEHHVPNDSLTCMPDEFLGCTSDGEAAYCSDDGRSMDLVECGFGCDGNGCKVRPELHPSE